MSRASHSYDPGSVRQHLSGRRRGRARSVPVIEQLVADGISEGCGDDGNGGTNFCPDQPVTRGQMARFLERAMRGATRPGM